MSDTIQFVTFAGGPEYVALAERLIESIPSFCKFPLVVTPLLLELKRPISSLHKPAIILAHQQRLQCEYTYFLDADMEVVASFEPDDILPKAGQTLAAVQHFVYAGKDCQPDDHTRTCWTPPEQRGQFYWQGCFFGGQTQALLDAMQETATLIWTDHDHSGAFDEPYLNFVFNRRRDRVRTLPCTFASPTNFPWRPRFRETYEIRSEGKPPIIKHRNYCNPKNRDLVEKAAASV